MITCPIIRHEMIRTLFILGMALSLGPKTASADPLPLAPGKPAGVQQAQATVPNSMLFVGLGVAVLGLGLYLASGTYKLPNQSTSATGTNP